jgi:NADH-quinone oxidoreductase subunit C
VPDATGLELTAQELRESDADSVLGTVFHRGQATIEVKPASVIGVLVRLRDKGYSFLASLHGVDYYPEEPRLGVIYELLDMHEVDRIRVKARVHTEDPKIATACEIWPGANHPEREVYDMFGRPEGARVHQDDADARGPVRRPAREERDRAAAAPEHRRRGQGDAARPRCHGSDDQSGRHPLGSA